jgi:hypothetical protein
MVDAVCDIDENRDLGDQQTVIKDTAATIFVGRSPLLVFTSHPVVV